MIHSLNMSLLAQAARVILNQRKLIGYQRTEILDLERCVVAHQHEMIRLAEAFLIALETPEADIRDDLHKLIAELEDGVAKLEEHVL